ncbi:LexA family protein [Burkholderia cepacia]|uniref:LexA family protein n=1 Tax=Burkholderia cepacia TaxID=292 RepID=UPI002AB63B04|nr:translesion error-prone DNA polymerase V autoproteolytic subunit [Burkholderia cepacia]
MSVPPPPQLVDCTTPALVGEVLARVPAGFPSPAQDHAVKRIDLNEALIRHPLATFFVTVRGPSMRDAGIDDGDRLLVDRAVRPRHGDVVVAIVDGELTVKRLYQRGGVVKLVAANPTYPEIRLREGQEVEVWGVAMHCIKALR